MHYLERMRRIATDTSKTEHARFLALYDLSTEIIGLSFKERGLRLSARVISPKERRAADFVRALAFLRHKYGERISDAAWADDSPTFVAGVLAYIESLDQGTATETRAKIPAVRTAWAAMDRRRNDLHMKGLLSYDEIYDLGSPDGNDLI